MHIMPNQTLGEQRVRVSFNPSQEDVVSQIKQKTAELIDLMAAMHNDIVSKDVYTHDITEFNESLRLIDKAQSAYELGAMWAAKAATHPDFIGEKPV